VLTWNTKQDMGAYTFSTQWLVHFMWYEKDLLAFLLQNFEYFLVASTKISVLLDVISHAPVEIY
jgi:hypothetical protein